MSFDRLSYSEKEPQRKENCNEMKTTTKSLGIRGRVPAGIFDETTAESAAAARFFDALEEAMGRVALQQGAQLRLQLLQSFRDWDFPWNENEDEARGHGERLRQFIPAYLKKLCPAWWETFVAMLNLDEQEILLKLLPAAHEQIGTALGLRFWVQAFLQNAARGKISVEVHDGHPYRRAIPAADRSHLGCAKSARLGESFALGFQMVEGATYLRLTIGQISKTAAAKLVEAGWMIGRRPGPKLKELLSCIVPFYQKVMVVFLIELDDLSAGFVLGNAVLARSRIGKRIS